MRVVAWSDDSGSRLWRLGIPFLWLNKNGHECYISDKTINDEEIMHADIIVTHNIVYKEGLSSIMAGCEISHHRKKFIVDVDDALFVNPDNPHKKSWEVLDASFVISQTIKNADIVTCSTENLRKKLLGLNKNVVVLPNYYDPDWFNVKNIPNKSEYLRIGWSGSISHLRDIKMVVPVIDKIMTEYPLTKFIICGEPRFKDLLLHKDRIEIYPSVPIIQYPKRLASMSLDIGIAPLLDDEFNSYKSIIKAMELSLLKIPSVVSNTIYKDFPYILKAGNDKDWYSNLKKLIEDKALRDDIGNKSYEYTVKNYNIKDNIDKWVKAYEDTFSNEQ